jgi:hypothetical protein
MSAKFAAANHGRELANNRAVMDGTLNDLDKQLEGQKIGIVQHQDATDIVLAKYNPLIDASCRVIVDSEWELDIAAD